MYKIICTTTDSKNIAENISKEVINSKLSPCAQIINNIKSYYIWNNELKNQREYLIQIKTKSSNLDLIKNIILDNHNYDIPEIISYDMNIENDSYKDWFIDNVC